MELKVMRIKLLKKLCRVFPTLRKYIRFPAKRVIREME